MVNDFLERAQTNPLVLAGLAIASGENVSNALQKSAIASRQFEQQKREEALYQQQIALQQKLPELLQSIDPNDPQGSINIMVRQGVPIDAALKIVGDVSKMQRQQQQQDLLSGIFGGGTGGDADNIAAYGAMTGNSALVQYGLGLKSNIEGKPPSGFRKEGGRLVPIPGGPEERKSPEVASKMTLIKQGEKLVNNVKSKLFDENGTVNNKLLMGMITNAPGTEGRTLRQQFKSAIRNKLRVESGAAIGDEEAETELENYLPSIFDNDAGKADKLQRLQEFFTGASQTTSPDTEGSIDSTVGNSGNESMLTKPKNGQSLSEMAAGDEEVLPDGGNVQDYIAEGTTATNPQTGQKIIFKNGTWVGQ